MSEGKKTWILHAKVKCSRWLEDQQKNLRKKCLKGKKLNTVSDKRKMTQKWIQEEWKFQFLWWSSSRMNWSSITTARFFSLTVLSYVLSLSRWYGSRKNENFNFFYEPTQGWTDQRKKTRGNRRRRLCTT